MLHRAVVTSVALIAFVCFFSASATADVPSGSPPINPQLLRARALFDDQRYEESLAALLAALVRAPETRSERVELLHLVALDYITLQKNDDAESAIRTLLVLDPDYVLPDASPRFVEFFAKTRKKWEAEGRPGIVHEAKTPAPVELRHASPAETAASKPIELALQLDDPDERVAYVRIRYRAGSHGPFTIARGSRNGLRGHAVIPASVAKPPLVEYTVEAIDNGGHVVAALGDDDAPLRIAVSEAQRSSAWVVPVAIGGGLATVAAVVGGLALAGVFKGTTTSAARPGTPGAPGTSMVTVSIMETAH